LNFKGALWKHALLFATKMFMGIRPSNLFKGNDGFELNVASINKS
jgi:hypothetical protein